MTNNQAIRILRDFNKWRRGEIADIIEDAYTIGQAIDHAIKTLKEYETESTKNQKND